MHASYQTVDDRPTLHFQRRIAHPVDAVWRALTEPDELEHWFPSSVEVELRVGGAMTFTFREHTLPDGSNTMPGEVTDVDPPRLLAFHWGEDHLRFELQPTGGGEHTLLRFTALLGAKDKAARDAAGWHVCLDRLEQHLGGASTTPPESAPSEEWRGHYEEYAGRGFPTGAWLPDPAA
jgi:uncharacterized protein YndB with AHSA1/START domain